MARREKPEQRGPEKIAKDLLALAVDIDSLTVDPNNARLHNKTSIDAIVYSLKEFGQQKAIVFNPADRVITAGNGTAIAARQLGWKKIAASGFDGPPEKVRKFGVADNATQDLSSFDPVQLKIDLHEFDFSSMQVLGFQKYHLHANPGNLIGFGDAAEEGEGAVDEEPADLPKTPITKRGDLIRLGEHRLFCGDSFKVEDVDRLLGGERVDVVVTDPPYAIYGSSTGIGADIADDKMVRPFFEQLGRSIMRVVREFSHVYVCCDWRSYAALWDGLRTSGLSPKNAIVWDKGGGGLGANYANTYEMIAYFARLPPPTAMTSTSRRGQRQVHRANLIHLPRARGEDRQHNAAKPVPLFIEFLQNSSDEGDVTLDLFAGSGTILLAAEQTHRRGFAMEIEPRWCDLIVNRWEKSTGKTAVRPVPVRPEER